MRIDKITDSQNFQGKLNPNVIPALDKMAKEYGYIGHKGAMIPATIGIKGSPSDYVLDDIIKLLKGIAKSSHKKTELFAKKIGKITINNQPPIDCYAFILKNSLLPEYEATVFGNDKNNCQRIVTPLGLYQDVGDNNIAMQAADTIALECKEAIKKNDFSKHPKVFRDRMNIAYEVYSPKNNHGTIIIPASYENAEHAIKRYEDLHNKYKGSTCPQTSEKFVPFGLKIQRFFNKIIGKK